MTSTMTARFANDCPSCGGRIETGSTIAKHRRLGLYVHEACAGQPFPATTPDQDTAFAVQWALDRYGPEGFYADGERTEEQATAWAVEMFKQAQADTHPDVFWGDAFGRAEARQEREGNELELAHDIIRDGMGIPYDPAPYLRQVTRGNAGVFLRVLGKVQDPEAWEIAAAINLANGRCPDGCCP